MPVSLGQYQFPMSYRTQNDHIISFYHISIRHMIYFFHFCLQWISPFLEFRGEILFPLKMYGYAYVSMVHLQCLPLLLSTYYFERGSLIEPGAHRLAKSSWHPPGLPLPGAEMQCVPPCLAFTMGAGNLNSCAYASIASILPTHQAMSPSNSQISPFSVNVKFGSLSW